MAGSIFAKLCRKEGIEFNLFDKEMPGRASIVSENLIGKSWYKGEEELVQSSLEVLRSIVPVREIGGKTPAWHVYTNDLLEQSYIKADAVPMDGHLTIAYHGNQTADYPGINVICAGVWTPHITDVEVDISVGHGLMFKGVHPEHIKLWAPFRYEKLIQRNPDELWFSDSVATSKKLYEKNVLKHIQNLYDKSAKYPNLKDGKYWYGYRPVMKEGHVTIIRPNGYVITGGNKAGMLHYPTQCKNLLETIKKQLR